MHSILFYIYLTGSDEYMYIQMYEEEGRGMFNADTPAQGGKVSFEPIEHEGLKSGEVVSPTAWDVLVDAEGKPADLGSIIKGMDVLVVYADPRCCIILAYTSFSNKS